MARVQISINITHSGNFKKFLELTGLITELGDLIPEWQHPAAKPIVKRISEIAGDIITTRYDGT